jgi:putative selenium metabolism protein SsnA
VSVLLKGGSLLRWCPSGLTRADLRIEDGIVTQRGTRLTPRAGEDVVDCRGTLVLPGFVCAHTHMYSALARAMPGPRSAPRTFPEILGKVWWKLDTALDAESIYCSALVGALDAVRCGTTTLIDHHASPNTIPGSLDIIRDAFRAVGVRGVLCYEVTDRGGVRRRDAGLAENDRFLGASASDPMFRGLVGAHASFTLSDDSLARLADLTRQRGSGIHIHVAEAPDDERQTKEANGRGIIDRLEANGLLTERSVFVHGVHLSEADRRRIRRAGAWLVHNPRSNMNNGVGHAAIHDVGPHAALGTDGWPADMLAEAQFAHFRMRERLGPSGSFDVWTLIDGGQRLVSSVFDLPIGTLEPGAAADLVVFDYDAPTPLEAGNAVWHALFGLRASMVGRVMSGGRWIYQDGRFPGLDLADTMARARRAAARLWTRMHA